MTFIAYCVFILYLAAMLCLALYAFSAFGLLLQYLFWYKSPVASSVFIEKTMESGQKKVFYIDKKTQKELDAPHVLIQLPIYNEPFVVERLLSAVLKIRYPHDRLTIQILDDSTDETSAIIKTFLIKNKQKNLNIQHIQRTERIGFKAGALAYGLAQTNANANLSVALSFGEDLGGALVAIFDADFVPNPDFLEKTIPHFYKNDHLALVQTRWAHLNENQSLLTRLQAMQLDVHFTIEQGGRNGSGSFMQFNGTAGVWRTAAIHDAGGWQADTLTEDLDLSYRAQLRGWKMLFDTTTSAPAELPTEMQSLIAQQFRWTKGGAECARKLLPLVLKAKLPLLTKINAITHLSANFVFVAMIIAMIGSLLLPICALFISLPMQYWWVGFVPTGLLFFVHLSQPFLVNTAMEGLKYKAKTDNYSFLSTILTVSLPTFGRVVVGYLLLLSLSMGIGFYNFRAVWEGWIGRKSPFVRTPKRGDAAHDVNTHKKNIFKKIMYNIFKNNKLEAFFCLALSFCFIMEIMNGYYIVSLIHGLWALGFAMVIYKW
jgi:cellulose synthase/poly-beta-1,6-N-acetylglucosamine synthase-like glycosyltransferase